MNPIQVDTDRIAADLYLDVSLKLRAAELALESLAGQIEQRDTAIAELDAQVSGLRALEAEREAEREAKQREASAKRAATRARNRAA